MAGLTLIADWVAAGQEFGVFEFYLPFVIMFAIFWSLLIKTKLFGDPKDDRTARGVSLIISLGASLYIMANTSMGISFAAFLSSLFGGTFMVILTIIAFVTVLYIVWAVSTGKDPLRPEKDKTKFEKKWWPRLAALTIIAAIMLALGVYTSTLGRAIFPGFVFPGFEIPSLPSVVLPSIDLTSQDLAVFLLFGITALIVFYVAWPSKDKNDEGDQKKKNK